MKKVSTLFLIFLCYGLYAGIAYDDASDVVYSDGIQSGDNGGLGFEPWNISDAFTNNFIISSAVTNGGWSATNNIDSAGHSFGIINLNATNAFIEAWRHFLEDLEVGQTFSFSLDVNWRGGYKGIRVQDHNNQSIFRVEVGNRGGGDSTWVDDVVGGSVNIGSEYSDDTQYNITLTQTSSSGGTWVIERTGGTNDWDSGSYIGTPSHFQLYSYLASAEIYDAIFFNQFNVSYIPDFDFYAAWINKYGLPESDTAIDADPDNDLMSNLREFALGGNPTNSDALSVQPKLIVDDNELKCVYNRYSYAYAERYSITYELESLENLKTSDWTNLNHDATSIPIDSYFITVTNHIPTDEDCLFLRLITD